MNSFLHLIKRSIRSSILSLASLLLLFSTPVNAFDLQCKLVENIQFEQPIIASMLEAVSRVNYFVRFY